MNDATSPSEETNNSATPTPPARPEQKAPGSGAKSPIVRAMLAFHCSAQLSHCGHCVLWRLCAPSPQIACRIEEKQSVYSRR